MQNAKEGGLSEVLRYADKEKTLNWLGLATPKAASSQVNQRFNITNIVKNFQNPKIDKDFLRMQALSTGTAESQPKPSSLLRRKAAYASPKKTGRPSF